MKDLSLHLLDIAHNSLSANASHLKIELKVDHTHDQILLVISDNGRGMSPDFVRHVTDPFTTTRTTRKVGLGIPLLKQNAERTGGYLKINSQVGVGTRVSVMLKPSNIDCLPLGDIGGTVAMLICSNPAVNLELNYSVDGKSFNISTLEIKEALDGVPLNEASVYGPVTELIKSNIEELDEKGEQNEEV